MSRFARRLLAGLALASAVACGGPRAPVVPPAISSATIPVHGLWTWRTATLLDDPSPLLDACRSAGANEVYLAVTDDLLRDPRLEHIVARLRERGLRVEALMGDPGWYRPAKWPAMLALIDDVIAYDAHAAARFDAIHLDVEPHILPENRSLDVGSYLPSYIEGIRRARARADGAGLALSADVPRKFFHAPVEERDELVRAVPRLFLMLYELRGREGPLDDARAEVARASADSVRAAYAGIDPAAQGELVVGLSVDDYGVRLAPMLSALDAANGTNARYAGWAIHDFVQYAAMEAERTKPR